MSALEEQNWLKLLSSSYTFTLASWVPILSVLHIFTYCFLLCPMQRIASFCAPCKGMKEGVWNFRAGNLAEFCSYIFFPLKSEMAFVMTAGQESELKLWQRWKVLSHVHNSNFTRVSQESMGPYLYQYSVHQALQLSYGPMPWNSEYGGT